MSLHGDLCFGSLFQLIFLMIYAAAAAASAKSLQSCPTLCDPMDCSPPGSPVPDSEDGFLDEELLFSN